MLSVLATTERIYEQEKSMKMFVSSTTLHGWRISIKSAIELIEEMMNANYKVVLTGKLNQDPAEVTLMFQ